MFAIALNQKQYKTYTLCDHKAESILEVVPERGGLITRWSVKGEELLYMDEERFADPSLTVRGGIPILFPICGNLPDNSYTYQNREYGLKQHGFARDLPWTVRKQDQTNAASITVGLTSNDETRSLYPFDFELEFTYTLKGNGLEIFQRYTNLSGLVNSMPPESMPFSTGLHPYFWVPDKSQLRFHIPAMQYWDQPTESLQDFRGYFDPNVEEIDGIFGPLTGLGATMTDLSRNLRLCLNYSAAYSRVVFWTVRGKDYVCLEPWSAPRNAMNTGQLLTHLKPGTSCEMVVYLMATFL
ncbi:MAG: aldose epimerase [Arthrospira sp. PLM2.Bin9]|nr:aldose epimerase [Arthrospira sp. PLM2.Bin9]TVU55298.1 MAG: aldose epimerase [Arthrospira sp. PLM2.Bin9]